MSTTRQTVERVLAALGPDAELRAMFGEYGLYFGGVFIGLVCDDQLYIKATDRGAALLGPHDCASPYPGAKPALVVPPSLWTRPVAHALARVTAEVLGARPRRAASAKR